jgi:MoaA/NifB/PqqE/SkfB family radical SAM enzyme
LVTLYVTERCNSRCVSCDYWRSGRIDVDLEAVERLVRSLQRAGTRLVVLSGGEPLIHPEWQSIARLLKSHGLEVWLLTSGLSLAKHARSAAALFEVITVSLDGTDRDSYAAIRGLDAFDKVCEGIRATARRGRPANLRITLQRANYRRLAEFVDLAKHLGARQVSFLAVDLANAHAFGRSGRASSDLKLGAQDLPVFDELIGSLERRYAAEFHSGFIAESPQKLRTIWQYFAALEGVQAYPAVRCNAPEFSAVIDAHGRVQPCFFIKGPREVASGTDLLAALDGEPMSALRAEIRAGKRPECKTCVCSMWRDLGAAEERR